MRKTLAVFAAASLAASLMATGLQAQPLRPSSVGVAESGGLVTDVQWRGGPRGPGYGPHYGPGYGPGRGYYGPGYGNRYGNCGWGGCNNNGGAVAAGVIGGLMLGAAAASAAQANSGPSSGDWLAYCSSRYRSFDARTGTYLGYDGLRHPCQ